jgi:hypothetical protein
VYRLVVDLVFLENGTMPRHTALLGILVVLNAIEASAELYPIAPGSDAPVVEIVGAVEEMDVGGSLQLHVLAAFGTHEEDRTNPRTGTTYSSSNEAAVVVNPDGLIVGVSPGRAIVAVTIAEGTSTFVPLTVVDHDRDSDGIPDSVEIAHGLNADDPSDANQDLDGDRISNVEEFVSGRSLSDFDLTTECVASVLNRSSRVDRGGNVTIFGIPAAEGLFRVRVFCEHGEDVVRAASRREEFADGELQATQFSVGSFTAVPVTLELSSASNSILPGETVQVSALARFPGGDSLDVSSRTAGTVWFSDRMQIATVDSDGMVTAGDSPGEVSIQAINDGVIASVLLHVTSDSDADDDGLPDDFEFANDLNPNDPGDATQDPDGDGLTNLEEFENGTNPRVADSDGDGINDGDEVETGTDPTSADSDGDGLLDGEEQAAGTDPLNPDTDDDGIADGREVDIGQDPITSDPTTEVVGRIEDATGAAVQGAAAIVFERLVATTDAAGRFSIQNVPASLGGIQVFARLIRDGEIFDGQSASIPPVAEGVTDVGVIQLNPIAGRVAGQVLSPRLLPVPRARVTVVSNVGTRQVNADVTGFYELNQVEPGPVTVTAVDPSTGLRGRAFGEVPQDGSVVVDVSLSASGTIQGLVLEADGASPAGEGVVVRLTGPFFAEVETDTFGRYRFDFIPLGSYTLEASDIGYFPNRVGSADFPLEALGERALSTVTLTATNQIVANELVFLGKGSVGGMVENALGLPVRGARVRISSGGLFGGFAETTTNSSGTFNFDGVFVGPYELSAIDTATSTAGSESGELLFSGDAAQEVITLGATGTLTGRVLESDGSTIVPNAVVTLGPSGRQMTADLDGNFTFENVPLGLHTITADHPGSPDRGRTDAEIMAPEELVEADVHLLGLADVVVLVEDGSGDPVPGAQVTVSTQGPLGRRIQTIASAAGIANFDNVLSGVLSIDAFDPIDALGGSIESPAFPGEVLSVTVRLEDAGAIVGSVFAADGVTPVSNVRVDIEGARRPRVRRSITTSSAGTFAFEMLPVGGGPYTLRAADSRGTRVASSDPISLSGHGDIVEKDLTLSGTGTVTGTVSVVGGDIEPGALITLQSAAARAPTFYSRSGSDGVYEIEGVPIGTFEMSARRSPNEAQPSATTRRSRRLPRGAGIGGTPTTLGAVGGGEITADGEVVVVDLELVEGELPLPVRHFDANAFDYRIARDGSIQDGTRAVFRGDGDLNRGGSRLEISEDGGAPVPFDGLFATFDEDDREFSIQGFGFTNLEVQRKVFVPSDGYFARYLEILTNPTEVPVTADVVIRSNVRFFSRLIDPTGFGTAIVVSPRTPVTSSGDDLLSVSFGEPDRWVIIDDDSDGDPFVDNTLTTVAHVFDGGGTISANEAGFDVDFTQRFGSVHVGWQGLVVPPGETVILMHFVSQQTGRLAAQASAERLVELPPEALEGLSEEELGQIVNYPVPLDGQSAGDELPPIDGTVAGSVLESDTTTVVPLARVRLRSESPFYGRTYETRANQSGSFSFESKLDDLGSSIAIPRLDFSLDARHPLTDVIAMVDGAFGSEESVDQDIVFSSTGRIAGTVRYADNTVVSLGIVRATRTGLLRPISVPIGKDGFYRVPGLATGQYTLTAEVPHPQGTALVAAVGATVEERVQATANITLAPTGAVEGIVRRSGGAPADGITVRLTGSNFTRQQRTDTSGTFRLSDVPAGPYTLEAIEPRTGIPTRKQVAVIAGQTITEDLDLIAAGTLIVEAEFTDGSAAANALVQLRREALGDFFVNAGVTDASGTLTIIHQPAGEYTVRVRNPVNAALAGEASGRLMEDGETGQVSVVVPIDTPPFGVSVTEPQNGEERLQGQLLTIRGTASDIQGISRVDFLIDGTSVGSDSSSPYATTVVAPLPTAGDHISIEVVAFDTAGQSLKSEPVLLRIVPDETPPAVTLTIVPEKDEYVEGDFVSLHAEVTEAGGVDRVEFSTNETDRVAPYSSSYRIPFEPGIAGPRSVDFVAVAYDNAGLIGQGSASITVIDDEPPTITLTTAPADGAMLVEGTSTAFAAVVEDESVQSVRVDLLVDGVPVQTRFRPPFEFELVIPPATTVTNPLEVRLAARDARGQTTSTPPIRLNVASDDEPTVFLSILQGGEPAPGEVVEGTLLTLSADATDDIGVTKVEFFADGKPVGVDRTGNPFSAALRLPGGADSEAVSISAVATDTSGKTGTDQVIVVRRDDTNPPRIELELPETVSVGPIDVAILINTMLTDGSSGVDIDGDEQIDNILEAQIFAARQIVDFLDGSAVQVAVIEGLARGTSTIEQSLTSDMSMVREALDRIRDRGPQAFAGYDFTGAIEAGTTELAGSRTRRTATPIQFFLSRLLSFEFFSALETTRAVDGGIIINTVTFGADRGSRAHADLAEATGGVYAQFDSPATLADTLPSIPSLGTNSLVVVPMTGDDVAVRRVTFHFSSTDGSIEQTRIDEMPPFSAVLSVPDLEEETSLIVAATAEDYGGNETMSQPASLTVFPSERPPEIARLAPPVGRPGDIIEVIGRFFEPGACAEVELDRIETCLSENCQGPTPQLEHTCLGDMCTGELPQSCRYCVTTTPVDELRVACKKAGENSVSINGITAGVVSSSKIALRVVVPEGATDGPVVVDASGKQSKAVAFALDSDGDGLSDVEEETLGTQPDNPDSDGDTLSDGDEVNLHGTNPLEEDSDFDGLDDNVELEVGLDPNNPSDAGEDFDGDGLTNGEEVTLGTCHFEPDSDFDGLADRTEVYVYETDPLNYDTDGGGRTDLEEVIVDLTDPHAMVDDLGRAPASRNTFTDQAGFFWTVAQDGEITGGSAFDRGAVLLLFGLGDELNPTSFFSVPGLEENGRELIIGPHDNHLDPALCGFPFECVAVARKVFVPDNDAFVRYLEILTNPTQADFGVTVQIISRLGSGSETELVATSSGDQILNADDDFVVTDDDDESGRPVVAHIFSGPNARVEPLSATTNAPGGNLVTYDYEVTVPAGERVILMHFALQRNSRNNAPGTCLDEETRRLRECFEDSCPEIAVQCIVEECTSNIEDLSEGCRTCVESAASEALTIEQLFTFCEGQGAIPAAARLRALRGRALEGLSLREQAEIVNFFAYEDTDLDGLSNDDETSSGTAFDHADTDEDGLSDGFEVRNGFNPLAGDDGPADPDLDLLDNIEEQMAGTDPGDPDTDGDDLMDGAEVEVHGTSPLNSDSDGDQINDNQEINLYLTNPLVADTDEAGRSDGHEILLDGTDPLDPSDDTLPIRVTTDGGYPGISVDQRGNVHIIWAFPFEGIFYSMLSPSGVTLIDDTLVGISDFVEFDPDPALAVDSNGRVHIVWIEQSGLDISYALIDPALDDQDGSPALVEEISLVPGRCIVADDRCAFFGVRPQIAVDSKDHAHIAWDTNNSGRYAQLASDGSVRIGERQFPLRGIDSSRRNTVPAVAIDSKDNVHLVWTNTTSRRIDPIYVMLDGETGMTLIDRTSFVGTRWSATDGVSISITADDEVILTYVDARSMAIVTQTISPYLDDLDGDAAELETIVLQSEKAVGRGSGRPLWISAVVDSSGRQQIVYYDAVSRFDERGSLRYSTLGPSPSLPTSEVVVADTGRPSWPPAIAVDGSNTYIAWEDNGIFLQIVKPDPEPTPIQTAQDSGRSPSPAPLPGISDRRPLTPTPAAN